MKYFLLLTFWIPWFLHMAPPGGSVSRIWWTCRNPHKVIREAAHGCSGLRRSGYWAEEKWVLGNSEKGGGAKSQRSQEGKQHLTLGRGLSNSESGNGIIHLKRDGQSRWLLPRAWWEMRRENGRTPDGSVNPMMTWTFHLAPKILVLTT